MSRRCEITGKGPMVGNNVSHAKNRTKRRFLPNLQKKRFFIPETGEWVTLKVSTSALKSINKLGIHAYLKKVEKKSPIKSKRKQTTMGLMINKANSSRHVLTVA